MSLLSNYDVKVFEKIKQVDADGREFWSARDLQKVLEYAEWRNFIKVVEKAEEACKNAANPIKNHFVEVNKMVEIGSNTSKEIEDVLLSRYACYLIVQNGDPKKEIIAWGQSYFAVQTRRQELAETFTQLDEDKKRLTIRRDLREHNKNLVSTARNAGVATPADYAIFQDAGYQGLYGGLKAKDIHQRKHLKKSQKILDYMNSTELAANLFRATQTEEKLRREKIIGKAKANRTHQAVGAKVRQTIKELGGTMPENLSTPKDSVQKLEKRENKKLTAR